MVFAQAVAEYGLMEMVASGVQKVSFAARSFFNDAGPGTWALIGVVVVIGAWTLLRRSSR